MVGSRLSPCSILPPMRSQLVTKHRRDGNRRSRRDRPKCCRNPSAEVRIGPIPNPIRETPRRHRCDRLRRRRTSAHLGLPCNWPHFSVTGSRNWSSGKGQMADRQRDSFLGRVRESLVDLHPAERRLGEFLCDFPGELASYNAQELAKLANVSKATVSRFVRRLGFENYEQARRLAREESQTGSRLFLSHAGNHHDAEWLAADIAQGTENLERTFRRMSEAQLDGFARQLLAARKVWVIGFRSSFAFATYLQWQLTQVIENIVAIPRGGETLGGAPLRGRRERLRRGLCVATAPGRDRRDDGRDRQYRCRCRLRYRRGSGAASGC